MSDIEKRMKAIDAALTKYETAAGLPPITPPGTEDELAGYLSLSRIEMNAMDVEACGEIAVRLMQFSFHLQRLDNEEKSRITWAQAVCDELVAKASPNYDKYIKKEKLPFYVAQDNEAVRKLLDIIRYAQQRCDRLNGLAYSAQNMARQMENYQRAKTTRIRFEKDE